jgi:hypothetical protein
LGQAKTEIFLQMGLDRKLVILPVGANQSACQPELEELKTAGVH